MFFTVKEATKNHVHFQGPANQEKCPAKIFKWQDTFPARSNLFHELCMYMIGREPLIKCIQ